MLQNICKVKNIGFPDDEEQKVDEADKAPQPQAVPRTSRRVEGGLL